MTDLPLDPEPVLGWRAWRLRQRAGGLRLVSLTRDDTWPAMEPMVARCHRATSHQDVPSEECSCGLYATSEPEHLPLAGITGAELAVVGAIEMWGRVIEHDTGARSQKAYPSRLRLVCGTCLRLGRGAVDPVEVSTGPSSMVGACVAHATGGADVLDADDVQAELLATYAVDLLPLERVEEALKIPKPPGPSVVRTVLEGIATGIFMILNLVISLIGMLWVIGTIVGTAGIVLGIVTHVLGIDEPVDAARSPAVVTPAEYVLADYPELDPPVRVVCGHGEGHTIEFARCASADDDVFGIAMREPGSGPMVDCLGDWIAYSFDDSHWVCWHPVKGEHPDVQPAITTPDPFAPA